ncbi:MAG: hypothetical protein COV30_00975 [Candidatus Yanofskybacteria bacterium CG10_big_fil_rev_8_21_14_0_10_37_15]|uniref:Dipeptidylpeptidase IV N-terminal domain-containing protein n=1 Tax=Candidatus Yanofskybacteria bacterium CG10_big_fil_rev_8_21_14_0_10_37_15 TaxID=1975097 RepID=A0A2H0R5Y8_9BACT|nr:MAG: hypothetical protein COV30_00975 [Candidatus Yanofskybacteria bacterium CG10_big_fil_rev_8_21_14_0_10_37_15]
MNNKHLIILLVLALSLAAFLIGFLVSQRSLVKQPADIGGAGILEKFNDIPDKNIKSIPREDFFSLSKNAVLSPTISKEKTAVIYHDLKNGQVFENNPKNLVEKIISDKPLPDLMETIWSPNKKEVVSVFSTNKGKNFRYYNYQTNKVVDLGTSIESLIFSPDGSRVAYFQPSGLRGAIYVSTPDGSSSKKIIETRLSNLELYWPSEEYISFKASVNDGDVVYLLSLTGNLTKLVNETEKINTLLWSPDGKTLLYSTKTKGFPSLFVKKISTSSSKDLKISTSAHKCVWSINNKNLFCAVNQSGQEGDDIYKINTVDGSKELVISYVKKVFAKQLLLTGAEDFLIIVEETNDKLYALKITPKN